MRLAVLFPGIGYHCDKPLLYYSRMIAKECGYDEVLSLDYAHQGEGIKGNIGKMQEAFEILYAQAEKKLEAVDFSKYDDVIFISKSVGTIIASAYAANHNVNCRHVLYTPLEYTYMYPHNNAIAFIGTGDTWSKVDEVIKLSEGQKVTMHVYEGLNHSLEGEDSLENIMTISKVMVLTKDFINNKR